MDSRNNQATTATEDPFKTTSHDGWLIAPQAAIEWDGTFTEQVTKFNAYNAEADGRYWLLGIILNHINAQGKREQIQLVAKDMPFYEFMRQRRNWHGRGFDADWADGLDNFFDYIVDELERHDLGTSPIANLCWSSEDDVSDEDLIDYIWGVHYDDGNRRQAIQDVAYWLEGQHE